MSMNTLLSRATRSLFPRLKGARLQVVAPGAPSDIPRTFCQVDSNASRYDKMIARIQRFRGRVYRDDGAIPECDLSEGTCHRSDVDYRSWHLLVIDNDEEILACIRCTYFATQPMSLDGLHLMRMVERAEPATASKLRRAVQGFLDKVNKCGARLGEVGCQAASPDVRNSIKAVLLPCACWSLGKLLGDPFGVATVTTRHHTADILHRLGGFNLDCDGAELGEFFDSYHRCEMQIMGFSIPSLAPAYRLTVEDITQYLRKAPVLAR